jgi:hypothetical protein
VSRRAQTVIADLRHALPKKMQRVALPAAFATLRMSKPYDPVDAAW